MFETKDELMAAQRSKIILFKKLILNSCKATVVYEEQKYKGKNEQSSSTFNDI